MSARTTWFTFPFLVTLCLLGTGVARATETLTMGVLAYLPKSEIMERYQPIADYLNKALGDVNIKIVALSYDNDEIEKALDRKELDLLLTNPGHYVKLKTTYQFIGPLVTQETFENGQPTATMGGVIFTRADRADIKGLQDLVGTQIVAPDVRSLGGYQAQGYEMLKAGLPLPKRITFVNKHDSVVTEVMAGKADVGFVRTGVLEGMARTGQLNLSHVKVLNRQSGISFPAALSTRLYPEWPIIATQKVSPQTIDRVTNALLSIKSDTSVARAARIAGFGPPKSYLQVEELTRALQLQ
ncbi:MAG: phosphate/phosphite/phosphonate ABC transporter substrate-binding protein [Burkholderiales bacterium]